MDSKLSGSSVPSKSISAITPGEGGGAPPELGLVPGDDPAEPGLQRCDAGAELVARVRYCEGSCPYANAFWDDGAVFFGQDYTQADDVVAHELTHGLTTLTAGLPPPRFCACACRRSWERK